MNVTSSFNSTNGTSGVNSTDVTGVDDGFNVPIISLVIGISNLILCSPLLTALIKLGADKLKKTTRYFLLYQTVCHLLLGVVGLTRGFLQEFSCEYTTVMPCIAFLICCSTLLICVDIFIVLYRPYTHKFILTPLRAKLAILFTIVLPLILLPAAILTGKDIHEDSVCLNFYDSYFTPAQILAFAVTVLGVIVLSIVFQGWSIGLIYRMNRVGPAPSSIQNVPMSAVHGREQAQEQLSALPEAEPVAGPSSSGKFPRTLQVTTHGALQSPEQSADTKGIVTIHILKSSEKDVHVMTRSQHSLQASTLHQNPTYNRYTRQKRLVRLLTAALILIVVAWSPTLVAAIIVSTYELVGMEKPVWFDTAKWQVGLLIFLDGLLYPVITISLSSELRACLKSLFCKLCRTSEE